MVLVFKVLCSLDLCYFYFYFYFSHLNKGLLDGLCQNAALSLFQGC